MLPIGGHNEKTSKVQFRGLAAYLCWEKLYIDVETAGKNLVKVKELGCGSIHVGGGEPFLDMEGLKAVLGSAQKTGAAVEYVETNSSWFVEKKIENLEMRPLQFYENLK